MAEKNLSKAVTFVLKRFGKIPDLAVVLGSGLSQNFKDIQTIKTLSFNNIPGMKTAKTSGHPGMLKLCSCQGKRFIIQEGRTHYYETLNMQDVVFLTSLLCKAGVKKFIMTNSAGGLNKTFKPGNIMLIQDHINLMGTNPLLTKNVRTPEFLDLSQVYSSKLSKAIVNAAKKERITIKKGIYLAVTGPCYETKAEAGAFKSLGADAVGMSTIPEAICAFSHGKEVAALSCITNTLLSGREKTTHSKVLYTASKSSVKIMNIIKRVLKT